MGVFPAHAGMFRNGLYSTGARECFPRARGDVPLQSGLYAQYKAFSPRTRGCSAPEWPICPVQSVFPAHAGMFLRFGMMFTPVKRFPRARGDVPPSPPTPALVSWFSPRTRGCSGYQSSYAVPHAVFPAHAGMFLIIRK